MKRLSNYALPPPPKDAAHSVSIQPAGAALTQPSVTTPSPRLLLASASPRRRELITRLGLEPDLTLAADIDESAADREAPRAYARRMAREKALALREDAAARGMHILGGDTVVSCGHRILPKAEDEATARRCLALLSGRRHRVLSAFALAAPDLWRLGFAAAVALSADSLLWACALTGLQPGELECLEGNKGA